MAYRITKEIGTGWSESFDCDETAWGVSESQRKLAKNAKTGDVFIHYIDHTHAWAGHSTVTGELRKNERDSQADWLAALPYVIPIKRRTWLNAGQCEGTVAIPGLSPKHYNRQAAFTQLPEPDAKCIMAAIDGAAATQPAPSEQFLVRWNALPRAITRGL